MHLSGPTPEVLAALRTWLAAADDPEPVVVETSGSTGAPKRVVLSRRAVLASVRATEQRLGAGPWLLALPPAYVAGMQVVCRSLVAGHEPVLVEDHPSFAAAVTAASPGFVSLVPTQLHRLLADADEVAALRTFRAILLGGGPVDPGLRSRAADAGVNLVTTYGSAETAGGCVHEGRALDGVALAVDPDGRLRVSGPMLFDRYDGDPALTAEVLVDGWFRTSDAARIDDDGVLHVLGRLDDMVVSGGVNVPAAAVARRLREHEDIRAAEVLGVPDEEWGNRLVAYVVGEVDLETVRAWVAAEHPREWAPRQLVRLDAMPLLGNGKPDRSALLKIADPSRSS